MVIGLHNLKSRDPDGANLRRLSEAEMFCDRLGAARSLIAHLAAMSAVLIWLDAIWPGLVNGEIRFLALAMFGANLILAVGVVTEEIIWRVRRKRCLDADQDGGP